MKVLVVQKITQEFYKSYFLNNYANLNKGKKQQTIKRCNTGKLKKLMLQNNMHSYVQILNLPEEWTLLAISQIGFLP